MNAITDPVSAEFSICDQSMVSRHFSTKLVTEVDKQRIYSTTFPMSVIGTSGPQILIALSKAERVASTRFDPLESTLPIENVAEVSA